MRDLIKPEDFEAHVRDPFAHHLPVAGNLQVGMGRGYILYVSNSDWNDTNRIGIDVDFVVQDGVVIPYCVADYTAYGGDCRDATCRIQIDGEGAIVPYDTETGYGCWIQYAKIGGGTPSVYMAFAYIVFGDAFNTDFQEWLSKYS